MGKKPSDLQTGIKVTDTAITGTLKYVTGYTGFNESVVEEQSGNYIALKMSVTPADAITTVEIVGGKKGAVQLDPDMLFVGRIADKDAQKIRIVSKKNEITVTKIYDLTGLTLSPKM